MSVRRQEFIKGARDTLPLMLGAFPFGMICGAAAVTSGLSPAAVVAMSAWFLRGLRSSYRLATIAIGLGVFFIQRLWL